MGGCKGQEKMKFSICQIVKNKQKPFNIPMVWEGKDCQETGALISYW